MSDSLYTRDILRLAVSIPHEERLNDPEGTADCRSKTCGSRVIADVRLGEDQTISDLGLSVNACALGQASAAILGANVVGMEKVEILAACSQFMSFLDGQSESPGSWQNMEILTSVREHKARHAAVLLPYDAVLAAIDDAQSNREVV